MTETTKTSARSNDKQPALPTHIAKLRYGYGKRATYERVGVMFTNADGSFYLKLTGKQLIDKGIFLYELKDKQEEAAVETAPVEDGADADEEAGE